MKVRRYTFVPVDAVDWPAVQFKGEKYTRRVVECWRIFYGPTEIGIALKVAPAPTNEPDRIHAGPSGFIPVDAHGVPWPVTHVHRSTVGDRLRLPTFHRPTPSIGTPWSVTWPYGRPTTKRIQPEKVNDERSVG